MSGLMEILVVIAIILGIIMLPRVMNRMQGKEPQKVIQRKKVPGWVRVAIVASILWPAFCTLYLKPWDGQWHIFLYVSLGPVLLGWGLFWVYWGFRKGKK